MVRRACFCWQQFRNFFERLNFLENTFFARGAFHIKNTRRGKATTVDDAMMMMPMQATLSSTKDDRQRIEMVNSESFHQRSRNFRGSVATTKSERKEGAPALIVPNNNDEQDHRFIQEAEDENDVIDEQEEKRPLHYWDDLRTSGIPFESAEENSAMFRLTDPNKGDETVRLGHIANLYPYSEVLSDGTRIPNESLIYIEAGMYIAVKDFNERSSKILPDLPEVLRDCNVYLTLEILDTILSPIEASRNALSVLNRPPGSLQEPFPISLAGAFRSAVTQPLATLSGVYQVPHVNGQSTSSAFDNKDRAPTFVRVVPTNRLDAMAYVLYLKSLGVFHFSVLYVRDAYGEEFNRDLKVAADELGMHAFSVSYHDGESSSIDQALQALKNHKHRYIFSVITPSAGVLKYIIRRAIDLDIIGNSDHLWLFSEAVTALLEPGFYDTTLDSSLQSDREVASALSGTGLVLLNVPRNARFDNAMRELGTDSEIYDDFVGRHDVPEIFDDFKFNPAPSFYQQLSYDAIMTLGIALCGIPDEFPTGPDIVDKMKVTEFTGVSGLVKFDHITGTRSADGLNFKVVNLIVDTSEESIQFEARTSALINLTSGEVNIMTPFKYAGGTENPPPLPPNNVDLNLLSDGIRALGWTMAAVTILLSAGFAIWTWRHRRKNLIRVAQPTFLCLMCIGTLLMASAIIPLSLQEPVSDRGLDIACMAAPWIFTLGFALAVASMLFKIVRLNKVRLPRCNDLALSIVLNNFSSRFTTHIIGVQTISGYASCGS